MDARGTDQAAARLLELRARERDRLGVGAGAMALALAATQVRASLAVPLFVGGLLVTMSGVGALWRRTELIERLSGDRDAYVIAEVHARALQEATIERRRTFAALVRGILDEPLSDPRVLELREELEALARDLDDETLALDAAAAVSCLRLLSDVGASPLLNLQLPQEDLRSRVRQIRAGFGSPPHAA